MRCNASSHCVKSALAKAITASSSSGSCMTSLTSTAKGLLKSEFSACGGAVEAGPGPAPSKDTGDIGASGGRPETICTGAGAAAGGSAMSGMGGGVEMRKLKSEPLLPPLPLLRADAAGSEAGAGAP